ncbi:MAG: hypothetical protein ACOZCL_06670 [Bacillota bacterium]
MGWFLFMLCVFITCALAVPYKNWIKFWYSGTIGMVLLYFIDSTLIKLGAFEFHHNGLLVSGLPLFYLLSCYPGGIVFAHYRPNKEKYKLLYIIIMALLLLALELIMSFLGYFTHINWHTLKSVLLNIFGFIVLLRLIEFYENSRRTYTS